LVGCIWSDAFGRMHLVGASEHLLWTF